MNKGWWLVMVVVGCTPTEVPPDAPGSDTPVVHTSAADVPVSDEDAPALHGCAAGCAMFNDGASECGVSNYECAAVCAESARIGADSGCSEETTAFWDCFAAAPRGAFCRTDGVCQAETDVLDGCVAATPPSDCIRACSVCGDSSYSTCALGCARRDAHAHLLGCDDSYAAYYTCRLSGECPTCIDETTAFTECFSAACEAMPERCPVTP